MNITRSQDCGNSPKNRLVEDLAVALAIGDEATASRLVTDDVLWHIPGDQQIQGRDDMRSVLSAVKRDHIQTLTITHVMTHGKAGAVNGTLEYQGYRCAFCDVFEFASARGSSVKAITSYRIRY